MGEAGGKPTRKLFRLRTVVQVCPADTPPAPLPEGFFLPRIRVRSETDQLYIDSLLARLAAKHLPKRKRRKIKHKRKPAKPVQGTIIAKLRAKFGPRSKWPKKMSTAEVMRQADIKPHQWHSTNRALGREKPKN